jgi:hydrogenase expression/formation protein HypE
VLVAQGRSSPYPAGKLPGKDLAALLGRYIREDPTVIVRPGVGRDAAVISFPGLPGKYLVAKTDPITFATDQIGWYAVHVNANDIAAAGGIPRWFLATLLMPEGQTGPAEVEEIFAQLSRASGDLGVILCGGHTEITHGLDRPIVIGQMLGELEEQKLVSPDKIRPGDVVLLTKGIAIEGTALIAREKKGLESVLGEDQVERCRNLLKNPGISVVREARTAGEVARVHAMHDPTEGGLATGLRELAEAAGLGMRVEMEKIAVFPETEILCRKLKLDPLGLLASGALLIVTAEGDSEKVARALRREGISTSVIGRIWEREKGIKLVKEGRAGELPFFERDEVARFFGGGKT